MLSPLPELQDDPAQALIAALSVLVHAEVTPAEIAAAAAPMADTIGVMLAGGCDPRSRDLIATTGLGVGPARLPGGQIRGAAADVALILGFAAHVLDFDDDETEVAMAHLSAPCLPAAMALATDDLSAEALVAAYVTGCKAMLLVGSAINPGLYRAGWHATSVLGAFGATATAARLLGLDAAATVHAFGLAASGASGPRGAFGGEGKPLQIGLAAACGVRAALLARAGWQAAPGALAGERGVLTRMAGLRHPELPGAFPPPGFVTKLYPTCTATHAAVAELIALRDRAGRADAPATITCNVDPFVPSILIQGMPGGPDAARFSLEYCLGHAALHGNLGPEAFAAERFDGTAPRDAAIRDIMARVRVGADQTLPKGPSGISTGAAITLIWADGTSLSGRRDAAPGSAQSPLSDDALRGKFTACLSPICAPEQAASLWHRLTAPTDFPSAGAWIDALPAAFSLHRD